MRFRKAWMPTALIALALSAAPAAAQGKGQAKGHTKQHAKAHKAPKVKHDKSAAKTGNPNMRFHGMDRNSDGIISRTEWSGNDRSFSEADWNGDGMLSGDEVKPNAKKPPRNP